MAFGICKLTGKQGTFVASHILPKSLTKSDKPGFPLIEAGPGRRPVRRFDSWFDKELVTRAGEDILSGYDADGIAELRRHGILWSKRPFDIVPDVDILDPNAGFGIREVKGVRGDVLRIFFLSILWRAAASKRPEFAEVKMPKDDLEQLRYMVLNRCVDPQDFYPIWLTQLIEVGESHNQAAIAQDMSNPSVAGDGPRPTYRFYFDGLVFRFIVPALNNRDWMGSHPANVGGDRLVVMAQRTADSFQYRNLRAIIEEAHAEWPDLMGKL